MKNPKIIEIENYILDYFSEKQSINILDAGCGSINNLNININKVITGIDISEKQLGRSKHLHKKILGDIEKYNYDEIYDLIICWDVLEHLRNPKSALNNFINAIEDGLIILKLPNVYSLKGLIAKFTPFSFHFFVYKYIFKSKRVQHKEFGPFKTFLRLSISKRSLENYAQKNNLKIVYSSTYDFGDIWNFLGRGVKLKLYLFTKKLVQKLSFGIIGDSELIIAFIKESKSNSFSPNN